MPDSNQQTKEMQSDTAMSFKAHWKHANRASKIAFILTVISGIIIAACTLLLVAMFLLDPYVSNHMAIGLLGFFLMIVLWVVSSCLVLPIILSLTQCFISSNKIPRTSLWISLVSGIYPGIFIFASIWMVDEDPGDLRYRGLSISIFFLLIAVLAFILFVYKKSRLYKNNT